MVITKKGGEKKGGIFFCLGVFFFDTRGLLEGKKKNVGKVEGVVFFELRDSLKDEPMNRGLKL